MLNKLKAALKKQEIEPAFYISQEVKFPVYVFDLKEEIDNDSILDRVHYDWDNSNRQDIVINAYQSPYFPKTHIDYSKFQDLLNVVERKANFLDTHKHTVLEYWYVVYKKNSKQNWHDHVGNESKLSSKLSAVYYAKIDDKSAPLIFLNSGKSMYKFYPKQHQLLIFDSRLKHSVPHNESDDLRVSFAFNLCYL